MVTKRFTKFSIDIGQFLCMCLYRWFVRILISTYFVLVYICVYTDGSCLFVSIRLRVYPKFKNLFYLHKRCEVCSYLGALLLHAGREKADGIATRYGVEGPGIECLCWRDFYTRPDRF
jgi:hypothetical protein